MSHTHERSEKVCLNCGALLHGRYCHNCGQENVEPKESVGHLIRHFFEDITHFDGKFFSTLKILFTRPGFLSSEYLAGRRARYLNPIRMYLFISFVFFFLFLSFPRSSAPIRVQGSGGGIHYSFSDDPSRTAIDTPHTHVRTVAEYKAEQDSLPADKRDSKISQYFVKKGLAFQASQKNGGEATMRAKEKFLHLLPQMFFVFLPLFALVLNLLYIRHRRRFNYVAHAIFTIHFYCFVFIASLVIWLIDFIPNVSIITAPLLIISLCIYLYKAMRKFYGQGRGKTFLKFILQNITVFVLFFLIASVYAIIAAFSSV